MRASDVPVRGPRRRGQAAPTGAGAAVRARGVIVRDVAEPPCVRTRRGPIGRIRGRDA
ncbi:hypothetical protein Arub01_33030 [Actinomadura rubrobrunea]|uniref:Uncharacterized protein n=1 Tax=Actinomadura rubrobrunea TaxID=115335 RepID=A0A9W6UVH5_9ACTN|nr:hypothetical protein [Actinomadura rubrobrunea]GLW65059.1 hypothetical protein Arub01_33030 [Actinomadura rubrobrunea]